MLLHLVLPSSVYPLHRNTLHLDEWIIATGFTEKKGLAQFFYTFLFVIMEGHLISKKYAIKHCWFSYNLCHSVSGLIFTISNCQVIHIFYSECHHDHHPVKYALCILLRWCAHPTKCRVHSHKWILKQRTSYGVHQEEEEDQHDKLTLPGFCVIDWLAVVVNMVA